MVCFVAREVVMSKRVGSVLTGFTAGGATEGTSINLDGERAPVGIRQEQGGGVSEGLICV